WRPRKRSVSVSGRRARGSGQPRSAAGNDRTPQRLADCALAEVGRPGQRRSIDRTSAPTGLLRGLPTRLLTGRIDCKRSDDRQRLRQLVSFKTSGESVPDAVTQVCAIDTRHCDDLGGDKLPANGIAQTKDMGVHDPGDGEQLLLDLLWPHLGSADIDQIV